MSSRESKWTMVHAMVMKSTAQEESKMIKTSHHSASWFLAALLCVLSLLAPGCASTGATGEFSTPEDAVQELVRALSKQDMQHLNEIFGPEGKELLDSGDEVADRQGFEKFLAQYDTKHTLEIAGPDQRILVIGANDWPFPVPIVKTGDRWAFDTAAGREEILNRRIGRNELNAIQVCLAIADAQREFAMFDANGDGRHDYAGKFLSDDGLKNGLYWPTAEGETPSPLGKLIVAAAAEGYEKKDEGPTPYHGYYYRILKAQGPAARGGALSYMVNGRMTLGFAVVAYPAEYGNSGIMTFIVSANGVVYESNLGEDTGKLGLNMEAYDPGEGWVMVE